MKSEMVHSARLEFTLWPVLVKGKQLLELCSVVWPHNLGGKLKKTKLK